MEGAEDQCQSGWAAQPAGFKGGRPQAVPRENNPFMIIGADVTHPMGLNRSTPSVARVDGSIDKYATRYAERSRLQGHRVEMICDYLLHDSGQHYADPT